MNVAIRYLLDNKSLSRTESYTLFQKFSQINIVQQSAILTLFSTKKITVYELLALRDFFLEHSILKPLPHNLSTDLVDMVGTGGDQLGSFNISTAASLVVASAGVPVVKHGGGCITSRSGSADVIQQLGVPYSSNQEEIDLSLQQNRYVYLHAASLNPMIAQFKPLRQALGFPTIFNLVGPLLNPLQPKRLVIGVYRQDLILVIAEVLKAMGVIHALVVHSKDGLDELSISNVTYVAEVRNQKIYKYTLDPRTLGLSNYPLHHILGGDARDNAQIIQAVFNQKSSLAQRNIVVLNAAAGLFVSGRVDSLQAGLRLAQSLIESGQVAEFLQRIQQKGATK